MSKIPALPLPRSPIRTQSHNPDDFRGAMAVDLVVDFEGAAGTEGGAVYGGVAGGRWGDAIGPVVCWVGGVGEELGGCEGFWVGWGGGRG